MTYKVSFAKNFCLVHSKRTKLFCTRLYLLAVDI